MWSQSQLRGHWPIYGTYNKSSLACKLLSWEFGMMFWHTHPKTTWATVTIETLCWGRIWTPSEVMCKPVIVTVVRRESRFLTLNFKRSTTERGCHPPSRKFLSIVVSHKMWSREQWTKQISLITVQLLSKMLKMQVNLENSCTYSHSLNDWLFQVAAFCSLGVPFVPCSKLS